MKFYNLERLLQINEVLKWFLLLFDCLYMLVIKRHLEVTLNDVINVMYLSLYIIITIKKSLK